MGGGRVHLSSWVGLGFRSYLVCEFCLDLWLILVMCASFNASFVRSNFVFLMLVCCSLGTLYVMLMSLIVLLKFI